MTRFCLALLSRGSVNLRLTTLDEARKNKNPRREGGGLRQESSALLVAVMIRLIGPLRGQAEIF